VKIKYIICSTNSFARNSISELVQGTVNKTIIKQNFRVALFIHRIALHTSSDKNIRNTKLGELKRSQFLLQLKDLITSGYRPTLLLSSLRTNTKIENNH
jgi:hypothetical protein